MVILTAFADEISADLEEQLDVLSSEKIGYLEFRSVWGKNVLKLDDDELAKVKLMFESRGFKVSSIGSPIGKIGIQDDFIPHLAEFRHAVQVAHFFAAPYIRIFSFFIPATHDPAFYREETVSRLKQIARIAEAEKVTLLLENEKGTYCDTGEHYQDILNAVNSPRLKAAFDPGNFVQCSVQPMIGAYPLIESYVEYIHIKDVLQISGNEVPAGKGDGQLRELFTALKRREYCGFMSLEPHLSNDRPFTGITGPYLFRKAVAALQQLLKESGLAHN